MKYDFIVGAFQQLNNLKPGHMKPGVKITCDSLLGASLLQTRVHTPGLFSGFRSSLRIPCLSLTLSSPAFIACDGRVCSVIWTARLTLSALQTWHRFAITEKLHERVHYK